VILVDGERRHEWLLRAIDRRLREEFAKLGLALNDAKSRVVDLVKGESFGFLAQPVTAVLQPVEARSRYPPRVPCSNARLVGRATFCGEARVKVLGGQRAMSLRVGSVQEGEQPRAP